MTATTTVDELLKLVEGAQVPEPSEPNLEDAEMLRRIELAAKELGAEARRRWLTVTTDVVRSGKSTVREAASRLVADSGGEMREDYLAHQLAKVKPGTPRRQWTATEELRMLTDYRDARGRLPRKGDTFAGVRMDLLVRDMRRRARQGRYTPAELATIGEVLGADWRNPGQGRRPPT